MMRADLDELMVVSCLCPGMKWSSSVRRPVLISREGNVLRLYWMPLLLWMDECRARIFIGELNRNGVALA